MIIFRKVNFILLSLSFLLWNNGFSQKNDLLSKEIQFIKLYTKLLSFPQEKYDSVSYYAEKFENEFATFIKNNPTTIDYSFKNIIDSNICWVKTSSDKNFRIYSWDSWTGGSMHIFKTIYQWKSNGKVFSSFPQYAEGDPGSFCSKIFTVPIKNQFFYLAITNGVFSNKDMMQQISTYNIKENQLIDTAKIFKTKTKKLNNISVEFDFFSVADKTERHLELITYDERKNIIYIPVVNENGRVSKKNILYQLKGGGFEFVGIETGKRK
jgi:hypothetical protein